MPNVSCTFCLYRGEGKVDTVSGWVHCFTKGGEGVPVVACLGVGNFGSFRGFRVRFAPLAVITKAGTTKGDGLFSTLGLLSHLTRISGVRATFERKRENSLFRLFARCSRRTCTSRVRFYIRILMGHRIAST